MRAFVTILANGDATLRTPYHAEFVAALKNDIPWDFRSWGGDWKTWTVESFYADRAVELVRRYFGEVTVEDQRRRNQESRQQSAGGPRQQTVPPDDVTLHLLPTAPPQLIDAAYKALARLTHPDLGGSTEAMQRLNAAYERLKGVAR